MPLHAALKENDPNRKTVKSLLVLVGAFLIFGLVIIADATVIYSTSLYGDPYRFALLQASWIIIGVIGFRLVYKTDYHKLSSFSYVLFLATLFFLAILAFIGLFRCHINFIFTPCLNGATRWLYFNPPPLPKIPFLGALGFQPSEFAKVALMLYLSTQLSKNLKKGQDPFLVYIITSGVVALLVLLEPNMSTAMMLFAMGTIIYIASGSPLKKVSILLPSLMVLGVVLMLLSPYRRARLMTLLNHGGDSQDNASGYHMEQVSIALGSGGFFGVGFGQSKQKYAYLPEIASDSIFAVIGEEFGFVGTTVVILAFAYLIYKGLMIARNAPDLLGRLLAVGVTSWIGLQVLINITAMAGLIPLTGVPLPLISYGGSSMLFTMMGIGVLANVAKNS